jgi:hypothetical protein
VIYVAWYIVNSLGIKNGKQLIDEVEYANYCQLSFKVKNKNVTMLHKFKWC